MADHSGSDNSGSDNERPGKRRRQTLSTLNADEALLKMKSVIDRIKLGQREQFFGPAMVMIAQTLRTLQVRKKEK